MPLTPLTSQLGIKRAAHLLRRTCLGGSKSEIDTFSELTPAEAVQQLFNSELPALDLPINPDPTNEDLDMEGIFLSWHLGQMLGSGVSEETKLAHIFRERLVLFFHTHFTTKRSVVNNWQSLFYQQALFRLFAFDQDEIILPPEDPEADPEDPASQETIVPRNFKVLSEKLCIDNAMLRFLDGRLNFSAEYYNKTNTDMLFVLELPGAYIAGTDNYRNPDCLRTDIDSVSLT